MESLWASGVIQLALVGSGIVIARELGPAGRGDLALILLLPTVSTQVVCFGIPAAVTYFIARQQHLWQRITSHLIVVAVSQAGLSLVLLFGLNALFLGDKSEATQHAAVLAAVIVPILVAYFYALAIFQGMDDIRWFNFYRLASPASFTVGLLALIPFGLTISNCTVTWILSQLAVTLAMSGQLAVRARRQRQHDESGEPHPRRGEVMRFGAAGFLAQVSPIESFRVDQLVTALFFSSEVLGYYVVASSVSNVPRFLADGIAAVAYPHVAGQSNQEGIRVTRRYLVTAAVLCGGASLLIAAALPWLIPLLFGERFTPAISIGIFLVIAAGLISVRRVGSDCLRALGRPGAATANEVMTWIVLLPAFLILGGWNEGNGVAVSLVIAAAVGLALLLVVLRRMSIAAGRKQTYA